MYTVALERAPPKKQMFVLPFHLTPDRADQETGTGHAQSPWRKVQAGGFRSRFVCSVGGHSAVGLNRNLPHGFSFPKYVRKVEIIMKHFCTHQKKVGLRIVNNLTDARLHISVTLGSLQGNRGRRRREETVG